MSRINVQSPTTNAIICIAPDFGISRREVWDVTVVLLVAGVAKQCHTSNFALEGLVEVTFAADDVVHDGSALGVAASNENSATGCLLESLDSLVDAGLVGALRTNVGPEGGSVEDWVGLEAGKEAL
jgi:hypothetical protein